MRRRIVLALGGNALGSTPKDQEAAVARVAKAVADLTEAGAALVLTHGNGPQVGMIHTAFEESTHAPAMPLAEATAMSQGYIGYHLQKAINEELLARNIGKKAISLVTEIEVSERDPAFADPSKPIGAFYSEQEAVRFRAEHPNTILKEDAGRGYRRVVASPRPMHILAIDAIRTLAEEGFLVIACGGGGIPIMRRHEGPVGAEAVVDKDFAAELLAEELDADDLYILTAVDRVAIHYNTPAEKPLDTISVAEAKRYCREGHFAPGSMLPKVEAAILFAESREGRRAVIASLEKAADALHGRSGTVITASAVTAARR